MVSLVGHDKDGYS